MAEEPTEPTTPPIQGKPGQSKISGLALYVAIAALVAWLVFTVYLLFQVNSDELAWTRIAWVFASVEAIAFAAAGALFGTAVQRENVERAEDRATTAEEVAESNRDHATKGRVLAASLQADAAGAAPPGGVRAFGGDDPGGTSSDVVERHAAMSRSLFGDLMS